MRAPKRWGHILMGIALLLCPFAIHQAYLRATAFPAQITLASGPEGGAYEVICAELERTIEQRYGIEVVVQPTEGSQENLQRLRDGTAHFALFMASPEAPTAGALPHNVRFASNVYSGITHVVVRADTAIASAKDLSGKRIGVGGPLSGNYRMSLQVLKHLGLEHDVQVRHANYEQMKRGLEARDLDAAIVTTADQAPIIETLARTGDYQFLALPYAEGLAARHTLISTATIPAGRYRSGRSAVPTRPIETVAVRTQLLTRDGVSSRVVRAILAVLHSTRFQQRLGLAELAEGGERFAMSRPQFEVHPGVKTYYSPEFRPLLDPDFVEATEGMRSFIVSIAIAAFLGMRWWREYRDRKNEHRLDRFFRDVLALESQQLELDADPERDDTRQLQELLDQVTELRQRALRGFSAHDLKTDRAADCFLEMCHALSNKIDAKLLRQRLRAPAARELRQSHE